MRVLMLTWEFPPLIAGGLGMACYGIVKALLKMGIEVDLVLPSKYTVYFPLRKVSDVDTLPMVFLDQNELIRDNLHGFQETLLPSGHISWTLKSEESISVSERTREILLSLGIAENPETYINYHDLKLFSQLITEKDISSYIDSSYIPILNDFIKTQNTVNSQSTDSQLLDNVSQYLSGEEDIFKKVQEFTVKAVRIAQTLSYDLIHSHDWLTYPAGMYIKKITGKPLVSHMHATEFDRSGGPGDERIHKIEFSGMSFADQVIAVSNYTAQMVITRYRIDTAKINIVHNAHTTKVVRNRPDENRLFKGTTILFLGRITIQKGPDYFLDVAKAVVKKHKNARFIMAGTGDMARKLLHKSASYKLRSNFLFTGFLNRSEVELILANSDIYMLPSISEPFGIAPLEAMAYGITAVISNQSGVAEVVENAYKIDFWDIKKMADTICYLIENPDFCKELGEKGRIEVEKIVWDDSAKHIASVYEKALNQ